MGIGCVPKTTHSLIAVGTEQASVVAFLHHDVGDAWLILLLKADTGLPDGQQLIIQHLRGKINTKLKAASSVDVAESSSGPTSTQTAQNLFCLFAKYFSYLFKF